MFKKAIRISLVLAFIIIPGLAVYWCTALPGKTIIPRGPRGGQYNRLTESLRAEISGKLGVRTDFKNLPVTRGSLENLRSLQEKKVDFCLYQQGSGDQEFRDLDHNRDGKLTLDEYRGGTAETFRRKDGDGDNSLSLREFLDSSSIRLVANLYSEALHVIVRQDSGIKSIQELQGKRVFVGNRDSGHYAMGHYVLQHYDLKVRAVQDLECEKILEEFEKEDDPLAAAFLTAGTRAAIVLRLLESGKFRLLPIEHCEALTQKEAFLSKYTFYQGFYRHRTPVVPEQDMASVSVRAQLLTRDDVDKKLVKKVTALVLSEDFLKSNQLSELLDLDRPLRRRFAHKSSGFQIHAGTLTFYDPELHPPINPAFVEAMEGMRSFLVSLVVAAFLGYRWLKQRRARKTEHKLDRFIRRLLEIERQQVHLDVRPGEGDLARLQKLLDDVTFLRQEALGELSAHELNEERGTSCFVEMCHDLSLKINAKITRQRFSQDLGGLTAAIREREGGAGTKEGNQGG